jgi:heme A synthase
LALMEFLVQIHKVLANMIGLYALLVGVWGLFNFVRRVPPDGNYNGALVLGVGLFVLQGIIGMVLVFTGLMPPRGVHFLYGVTIALVIPGIFAFTRGSNSARESMLYGLGMVFIWGLADRATATGAP